jgi:hypothetical protein
LVERSPLRVSHTSNYSTGAARATFAPAEAKESGVGPFPKKREAPLRARKLHTRSESYRFTRTGSEELG